MTDQKEMSFIDHLEELRWHLIRSIIAIFVVGILAFLAKSLVFDTILLGPYNVDFKTYEILCSLSGKLNLGDSFCFEKMPFTIQNIDLAGQFLTHIKVSILLGFIVSFPYVLWEIWRFVSPGLHLKEKRYTRGFVFFASLFFFIGVLFGYFIIVPFGVTFLGAYQVSDFVMNEITLASYMSTLSTLVLATGLIFELPMLVFILSKIGILTDQMMRDYRRYAVVGILLISAIITPADVFSQLLMFIPIYILYEFSILIAKRVNSADSSREDLPELENK